MKKLAVVLSMLVGVGIFLTGCNNEENSIQAYTDELNAIYENPEVYQEIKEYFGANDLQMMSIPFYGPRYICPACGEDGIALPLHYLNGELICQTSTNE